MSDGSAAAVVMVAVGATPSGAVTTPPLATALLVVTEVVGVGTGLGVDTVRADEEDEDDDDG